MRVARRQVIAVGLFAAICVLSARAGSAGGAPEDALVTSNPVGHRGGIVTIALRSEPKTLNPALATDASSLGVIYCMNADLIHINRETQRTEPALAKSWSVSRDGRTYTLQLRRGIRFSDGQPFSADDVIFSFDVYLDKNTNSPQRDLLIVGGKPISVEKLDDYTVRFELAQPYAAAERLFDGFPILPKHLLQTTHTSGGISQAWTISTPPEQFAGLGPFRLKEYVVGQRLVLERNPYYWKQDSAANPLPYLDGITFLFVPSEDAQVIRFLSGDTDILSRFSADNFVALERQQVAKGYHVFDLGPGLEYSFLFFNLNDISSADLPDIAKKQWWFRDLRFREAVSTAIDRDAIVRLIYQGRAASLTGQVTPGNKLWVDASLPAANHSLDRARELLKSAGFSWKRDGSLLDSQGKAVEFSILTSSSNTQRTKMATIIQDDLNKLGMNVHVVSLDFGATVDRLLNSFDYEAAISGLADGDADPNTEMNVWLSTGGMHIWHLNETHPATPWETELDRLMNEQLVTMNYEKRKLLYDRVQEIVAQQLPVICLVSPDILVGAKNRVGNFSAATLDPYVLWNIDSIYVR
jgi:peptide/nickel transport system substrate-binding protein